MLPLSLLSAAKGNPMLIELKNGDTYNGRLVSSDSWMNINLQDVICTSREGDRFWELKECYIRGSAIKYLRIPDEVLDAAQEDEAQKKKEKVLVNEEELILVEVEVVDGVLDGAAVVVVMADVEEDVGMFVGEVVVKIEDVVAVLIAKKADNYSFLH
eukprot:CAMPEP_0197316048 /NCGR_PEP_ID=MMETSP0891-20130614/40700_1 /TAXON_ID=44058 ORGANISM="Aureoumbra lagunensis, Strain CCMP1510" /NCGR_SAMPLE_ID=MMETSP0891 /ASSEMBLY_ACC=CAM_ASM_000534 /LENGTH=156 /DNA_ID=CAMNT_0042805321 /DNA_START=46 /DNA_END=517 /DNA_ORIENTATION=-